MRARGADHAAGACVKLRCICEHIKCQMITIKAALFDLSPVVFSKYG